MKKNEAKGISVGRIAENRRAKFDYTIIDTIEAGIILLGSEVKSLRLGRASIAESYATEEHGHIVLINSNIPEYSSAARGQNHEPKRIRRLLIHKKERNKILYHSIIYTNFENVEGDYLEFGVASGRSFIKAYKLLKKNSSEFMIKKGINIKTFLLTLLISTVSQIGLDP